MIRPSPKKITAWIRANPAPTLGVYVVLLIVSNISQFFAPREWYMLPAANRIAVEVPELRGNETAGSSTVVVSALDYGPDSTETIPVILLHGSPGQSTDFTELGPELAAKGRRAFALDMPGFGLSSGWVPDYSARAYAGYVLGFMDAQGIERAHLVGWSNGGAVALNAVDLAPDRVASLTLLAAIACQETEGSGDYYFEHAKYAVGYGAAVILPELIPHFGLLFPREYRHAFIRNFWDTDQRPIRAIMESVGTPTLILHGRHDPLVSDWAAERHHELIPTSRLVMTEHSHFMPFMQAQETAGYLDGFFDRHDEAGVPPLTDAVILEPPSGRAWFRSVLDGIRHIWWPIQLSFFVTLSILRRESTTAIAGLLVGYGGLDFGVACVGLFVGRVLRFERVERIDIVRRPRSLLGTLAWTAISLLIAQIALGSPTGIGEANPIVVLAWVLGVAAFLNIIKRLPTRIGRRELVVFASRFTHHEWWPSWVLYALLFPHFVRLAMRHRSLTVWTCVNPGIRPGGGIMGESKVAILDGLEPEHALKQIAVGPAADPADAEARLAGVEHLIETDPSLVYPVVLKPEAGERGDRVAIVRTPADLRPALGAIPEAAIVQRYHPGPVELGVFWVRDPATVGDESTDTTQGSILAVTLKVFPELVCDGVRTVREQILVHRRYRMQAGVYCAHLRNRLDEIPPAGTCLPLTDIGNHVKGCRFEDGADLITPELSGAIDRLARSWRGPDGEPFDYGRFDLRSGSKSSVRAGEDLAIIELNGVTSEATNLYDPSWPPVRALGLLAKQWTLACELGAARWRLGSRPMSVIGLVRVLLGRVDYSSTRTNT